MNRNIAVILSGRDAGLSATITRGSAMMAAFQKQSQATAVTAGRAGAAIRTAFLALAAVAAIGLGASIAKAIDFEREMRNVNSIAHESEARFQAMGNAVLDMATKVPQSATTLAKGLYDISSSGFAGADALHILEVSSIAASAGLSTTEIAAKAVTAVLNAYGLSARSAGDVADILFRTVDLGVITFEELASQIGDVIGQSSSAKVEFDEVGAALAAMTLSGLSAAESTTSLNNLIRSIIKPSEALKTLFKQLGYESGAAALEQDGLYVVMEKVRGATGGGSEELLKYFPNIRAARAAFALGAADGENYARVQGIITDETQRAGATQRAFNEQMKALGNQWDIFTGKVEVAAIKVGTALIPSLSRGLSILSAIPGPALAAGAALGVITLAVLKLHGSLGLLAGPLGIAGLAVGGLVGLNLALESLFSTARSSNDLDKLAKQLHLFGQASETARKGMVKGAGIGPEFDKLEAAIRRVTNPSTVEGLLDLSNKVVSFGGLISDAGTDLGDAKDQLEDFAKAIEQIIETQGIDAASAAYVAMLQQMVSQGIPARDAMEALDEARRKVFEATLSSRAVTDPLAEVEEAAAQAEQAVSDFKSELSTLFSEDISPRQAADEVASSIHKLRDEITGASTDFANNTQAAIDNRAAVDAVGQAMLNELEVMADAGVSQDELAAKTANQVAQLQALKTEYPQLTPVVDTWIGLLESVPAQVSTTIGAKDMTGPVFTNTKERLRAWNESKGEADLFANNRPASLTIHRSEARLKAWNESRGVADVAADDQPMFGPMDRANRSLSNWDRRTGTADVRARDHASGILAGIKSRLDAIQSKSVTVSVAYQSYGNVAGAAAALRGRHGLIVDKKMQLGGVLDAGFARDPSVLFGERGTGGEAFIPRRGNPNNARMVLATAASWYGMEMRPAGSGAGPTINDFRTFVTVEVRARGSITDPKGLVKMMRNEIGEALDGHDRKLARGLVSR